MGPNTFTPRYRPKRTENNKSTQKYVHEGAQQYYL